VLAPPPIFQCPASSGRADQRFQTTEQFRPVGDGDHREGHDISAVGGDHDTQRTAGIDPFQRGDAGAAAEKARH